MKRRLAPLVVAFVFLIIFLMVSASSNNKHIFPKSEDTARALSDVRNFAVTADTYTDPEDFESVLRDISGQKISLLFVVGDMGGISALKLARYEKTYTTNIVTLPDIDEAGMYRPFYLPGAKILLLYANFTQESQAAYESIKNEINRDITIPLVVLVHSSSQSLAEYIHPLLAARGNALVVSGSSPTYEKDRVQYFPTATLQGSRSYTVCIIGDKVQCGLKQIGETKAPVSTITDYKTPFFEDLKKLAGTKPALLLTTGFRSDERIKPLKNISYATLEKNADCSFPEGFLQLTGSGFFEKSKYFSHLDLSDSQRLYFIDNKPEVNDSISSVQLYRFLDNPNDCKTFQFKLFDQDFTSSLSKYRAPVDNYHIEINKNDLETLTVALPSGVEERLDSDFKFPYVDGKMVVDKINYDLKIKNRGLSPAHWEYNKKSYTLKFKDYFKHNQRLLIYVPDKRAYTGEYLTNQVAKALDIPALDASFKEVFINDKSYGTYYVSEDFDNLFLAKRGMPEANIYNTDPLKDPTYAVSGSFTVSNISKNIIVSNIKDYEKNYDRDADYFLSIIKSDKKELAKRWSYYFDQENLAGILALMQITGTAHYDFHNIVFYINPDTGKLYFFPWDLMNYTHVGDLQRVDLTGLKNDYINVNELFVKLLEIPEIRALRNRKIYGSSADLLDYLEDFDKQDNIRLMSLFFTDPTIEFPEGEGNKPSLVTFLRTPQIIIKNINYLRDKISEQDLKLEATTNRSSTLLNVTTNSYGENTINRIIFKGPVGESIGSISVDGFLLEKAAYSVKKTEEGLTIRFLKGVSVSPILEYKEVYASPVLIKPDTVSILIEGNPQSYGQIDVEMVNPATGGKKVLESQLVYGQINVPIPLDKSYSRTLSIENKYPAIKSLDGGRTFILRNPETVLDSDIVLPRNTVLKIDPGSTIKMGEGVSLISYGEIIAKGTKEHPIIIMGDDANKPWGVLAVVQKGSRLELDYCKIQGGSSAFRNGSNFSGMVSAYDADTRITNSEIADASRKSGDDGLNVKLGFVLLKGNVFRDNKADAVDLDFIKDGSLVSDNVFQNNANDHLDLSGSRMILIQNNQMRKSGDKGISVGEGSDVIVKDVTIEDSRYGIASKDDSFVTIRNSIIKNTKVGVASYNKKELFGGSRAYIYNSTLANNGQDFGLEFVDLKDWRFGDPFYRSYIYASSSLYRLTGRVINEVILEVTEAPKSKKELYKKASKRNIDSKGNVYAKLTDIVTR